MAHELRTPLAELRLLNEVALQEADGTTARPSTRPYFEDALELLTRIERLLEILTTLTQFETKAPQLIQESFDIARMVQNSWKGHARDAEAKQIVCSFNIPQPTIINTDRAILSAIIDNLISNAIAYSPVGSSIMCRLSEEESIQQLEFINPGTDLSSTDLDLLLEPFWQKDTSRTSTKRIGLGLTLVKTYCKVLAIKMNMLVEVDGTFHVLLRLPTQAVMNKNTLDQSLSHSSSNPRNYEKFLIIALIPIAQFFLGCVNVSQEYSNISDRLEVQTGFRSGVKATPQETVFPQGVSLEDGITLEEAITVALWNNAVFQEILSGLGVSHADVIQANMLQNPQFWGVFPSGSSAVGPFEFAFRFPLEALWVRPLRVEAAQHNLKQVVERLVQHGLNLIRDVKIGFGNILLAEQRLALTRKSAEVLRQIARITDSRWKAGEISELEAGASRIERLRAEAQIQHLTQEVDLVREQFRILIGLGFEDTSIVLQSHSPLPTMQQSAEELLTDALATRPDLRAAELELEGAGIRVELAHKELFVLTGIYRAKETGTDPFNSRPGIQLTVPLFNQNQGGIALAEATLEVAIRRYVSVRDRIALEVRQAHTRWLQTVRSVQHWRQRILPAHRTATFQAQKVLEAGDATPLLPLAAQRDWIQAQIREVELIAGQRRAIAELERAIGHSLDVHPNHPPATGTTSS